MSFFIRETKLLYSISDSSNIMIDYYGFIKNDKRLTLLDHILNKKEFIEGYHDKEVSVYFMLKEIIVTNKGFKQNLDLCLIMEDKYSDMTYLEMIDEMYIYSKLSRWNSLVLLKYLYCIYKCKQICSSKFVNTSEICTNKLKRKK